jgi:hypothetical protein
VEIYNEFSLQHELGGFLRGNYRKPDVKVQFERNVKYLFDRVANEDFIKKEVDITVFDGNAYNKRLAIELKYPKNGQYPQQMYSFCKDIKFAEQLVDKDGGFEQAIFIVFADDQLFYGGGRAPNEGIYRMFRDNNGEQNSVSGVIRNPAQNKDDKVSLRGKYFIKWHIALENLKYAIVLINPEQSSNQARPSSAGF